MYSIDEVSSAIFIAVAVATFLLNTSRSLKAIELCKECLLFLKDNGQGMQEELAKSIYSGIYYTMFRAFSVMADYTKAIHYGNKVLLLSLERAILVLQMAEICQSQNRHIEAKELFERAINIMVKIGYRKGEAAVYGKFGIMLYHLGEFDNAKEYMEKALAITIEIGDRKGEAACYGNLVTVFQSLGEYLKAKEYLEKSLLIRKKIGDKKGEAADYGNLGTVFQSLGEYLKSQEYLEKALVITLAIGDKEGEAAGYGSLGIVFHFLGEYSRAKEYLEKALVIKKAIGNRAGEAACYGSLGTVFQSLGEYLKAKEYHEKALAITKVIGDKKGEAAAYGSLGTVFQSLGEYLNANKYLETALAIRKAIGDRKGEAACYRNLGTVYESLGEYLKAMEYHEKALVIMKAIGDKEGEAAAYGSLGTVFLSLGEFLKAKEYFEKALVIMIAIGDKKGEPVCYGSLGAVFQSLGEYSRAKEYHEKALVITKTIGDRKGEAACYGNLGIVFQSLGEYLKAKEYHEKALVIRKAIGDREGEAKQYGNLGSLFNSLGEYGKAEENLEKAITISKDIGYRKQELFSYCDLSAAKLLQGKPIQEVYHCLFQSIDKCEDLRFLVDNDQFKISFSDFHISPYQTLAALFFFTGNTNKALYVAELGRARALADLMAAQYSAEKQISSDTQSWVGIESIMKKESNCTCLYIAYYGQYIYLWILRTSGVISYRSIEINEDFVHARSVSDLDEFFAKSFRSFGILPEDECEDRSLNDIQQESSSALRLVEDDDEESQDPEPLFYKMIIAPVADLLKEPEIIIVPDRSLYQVPFAALIDERGMFLSETFRIRIVPSLTILKLIQDSPADYHSQSGALIVGNPDVGWVFYKERLTNFEPLPCAEKEAQMIGQLLGVQPLVGDHATKQAVLQRINSVSLIHFAAHGDAERGEIALTPLRTTHRCPQEEDYLLTMSDISQVQLRAKLVVLSCCHSGRGQIRAEGAVGIARAFLGSGARSVLVALWALGDRATEQFMRRFYEHLIVRGESASKSLHETMKWMRANGYPKVCDWAPFMLIGDNVTFEFGK